MKNTLLLFIAILVFSCSPDDSPSPNVPDNNPVAETPDDDTASNNATTVKLSLEGITELDFNSMEVVSINNVTSLNQDGEFDISEEENQDDFPFLFVKNEELLFGYYRNPNGSEITNEDILFYYFSTFPAISIRGINDDLIAEILFTSQYLPDLEKEMVASLNLEQFPFENDKFNEVFALVAQEMFAAHDVSNKSKDVVGEFSIDYSRDGMITWPTDVPLFATIGVEIIDNASGNVVQSSFLQPKSLDVVRGLYDLVNDNNEEYVYFYQLLENGSYSINFNNGNPNFYDNAVTAENRKILVSKALNFAFLGLLKTFKNLNSECAESVTKVFDDALVNVVNQKLFATLSGPEAISVFKELVISMVYNLADIVGNCISSRFLTSIAFAAIKALTFGLEISEILFYFRDFSFSNIYGTQARYFQDGISVGTLNETIISPTNFSGRTGDVFSYTANYEELKQSYEVDRSAIESKFILNEEFVPAIELPFNYEFIGDVNIETSNPLETFSDGDLEIFFTVGEQDSEIAVVPDFNYPVDLTKFLSVTVAETCGNQEIQEVLSILEGKIWCEVGGSWGGGTNSDDTCSISPWTIESDTRIYQPPINISPNISFDYEFFIDQNCENIYLYGIANYNGFTITYKLLQISESIFEIEVINYPGGNELHAGKNRIFSPK